MESLRRSFFSPVLAQKAKVPFRCSASTGYTGSTAGLTMVSMHCRSSFAPFLFFRADAASRWSCPSVLLQTCSKLLIFTLFCNDDACPVMSMILSNLSGVCSCTWTFTSSEPAMNKSGFLILSSRAASETSTGSRPGMRAPVRR